MKVSVVCAGGCSAPLPTPTPHIQLQTKQPSRKIHTNAIKAHFKSTFEPFKPDSPRLQLAAACWLTVADVRLPRLPGVRHLWQRLICHLGTMQTCVLVNTHGEGVPCSSRANVARMFHLFKVVHSSNYVCVWDNVPLICIGITNVFVTLLMDLLLILASALHLPSALLRPIFSCSSQQLILWQIYDLLMLIWGWWAGGQWGAECLWELPELEPTLSACFVWKLLLSVSALKFYSKAPMIQFLWRLLSTCLHMWQGQRAGLKGSNAEAISCERWWRLWTEGRRGFELTWNFIHPVIENQSTTFVQNGTFYRQNVDTDFSFLWCVNYFKEFFQRNLWKLRITFLV